MSKKEEKQHDELENVQNVIYSTTEAFIEKYQKQILYSLGAVILIVLAILGFKNFYLKPREVNAEKEMYKAQVAFNADSYKIAVEGGEGSIGFKEIASEYSITESGKLASAYAGICYYRLGKYEDAVKYLSQFDGKDDYFSNSVIGLIGDCYVEMNQNEKALDYFKKAYKSENEVVSPVYLKKAAIVYEAMKENEKAEELYTQIKEKYPKSVQAVDIDKYIARVQK